MLITLPGKAFCSIKANNFIQFQLNENSTLCIDSKYKILNQQCTKKIEKSGIDEKSKQMINQAEEKYAIFSQPSGDHFLLVMLLRLPSTPPHSAGYCGAGYEDHLALLSEKDGKIMLLDDFLIQSCLKSKILDSDQGDDIMKAISIDKKSHSIKVRWLSGNDDNDHVITVKNEKFMFQ